jgi:hypothetical protein
MATLKLSGRIVGTTIELDSSIPMLEGQRVVVTVETEAVGDDPVARAFREAPLDDRPATSDERAAIEDGKAGPFITTAELRARVGAARGPSSG